MAAPPTPHDPGSSPAPGLYIHVPFCTSVCPYCDFAVLIGHEERRQAWLLALLKEMAMYRGFLEGFDTIYLGGGTPSSLVADHLERLVASIFSVLDVAAAPRLAIEVNTEDVSPASAGLWRELGFATVSLGLQSLDDEVLRYLGRGNGAHQGRRAYETLRQAGFDTVSVDLIYGLDGQQPAAWRRQLDQVIALAPDHISCYQLTFHEQTLFGRRLARGQLRALPEEQEAELFHLTHQLLADAGYQAYEVSNFARGQQHRSAHNRKYWEHTPYLGLGPSAHSFDGSRRWWNLPKERLWRNAITSGRSAVAGEERLSPAELAFEMVMLGLRTAAGIDLEAIRHRTGIDLEPANQSLILRLAEEGMLGRQGTRLVPTLAGLAVADGLARQFEVDPSPSA